jgi:hypothetical protein
LRWVTHVVGRGSRVARAWRLRLGGWHVNHALDVVDARGRTHRLVLRRWARPGWDADDPDYTVERETRVLEHEEHAAREVCVAVLVASDLAAQVLEPYLLAENLLGARRTTAEKLSDRVDRRARVVTRQSLEHDHEIVVALAGRLATAPRAHQNDGRIPIRLKLCNSLPTFDQAAFGQISSSPDAAEPNAGSNFQASDARAPRARWLRRQRFAARHQAW